MALRGLSVLLDTLPCVLRLWDEVGTLVALQIA